ncbi:MAG: FAD-dependent oxidoreductase [Planctomycetota bacterium]
MKVAVVGGGVSGVAAARFLKEAGNEVEIFEKAARSGGLMRSDTIDGYVFDRAGGHILYSKDDWFRSFIAGIFQEGELHSSERNTKILYRDRFVHYPFENGIADLEPEDRLKCVKGYVEAWARREAGAPVPDNFLDWVKHRLGDGICETFMKPYNEKIWKCNLSEMGIEWVEGRVPTAPLEDILRSAMGQRTEGYKHQISFQYPLEGGFQTIHDRIEDPVRSVLRTGAEVRHIERKGEQFDVDGTLYDLVISTIPLPELADILTGLDATSREAARALRSIGVTSLLFGIDQESVRPYSWLYLPHPEQGPANRVTYLSNYSPRNAPEGRGSLQAEVTHAGPLKVDREYLISLRDNLGAIGLLNPERVDVMHYHSNRWGYILFDRDFVKKRRLAIDGVERLGVHPLGRFGRFDYHNSDQCVIAAKRLVERILAGDGAWPS